MQENKLFEALLDVMPFPAYAVDIDTFEVVYANRLMQDNMYAPREEFCWKKVYGQEEICSWCSIAKLRQRGMSKSSEHEKEIYSFFDEASDKWFQSYDELVKWPDGRTVKYSIAVDITDQKEIQGRLIKTNTTLAIKSKQLKAANEQLEFMAKKDFLTEVNNRGHFFTLAKELFDNDIGEDIYVAMLDIDNFKSINDNYGHKVGDEVLKIFAKTISESLDEKNIFGRMGGEEFALIITSYYEQDVVTRLKNIKESIQALRVEQQGGDIRFTVSIGVSKKEKNQSLDMVLDEADQKLYEAKGEGKNRVRFRGFKDA